MRQYQRRTFIAPLFWPVVSLAVGIAVARAYEPPMLTPMLVGGALLLLTLLSWRLPVVQSLSLVALFGVAGTMLGVQQRRALHVDWPPQPADYAAVVASTPVVRGKTLQMDAWLVPTGRQIRLRMMREPWTEPLSVGDGLLLHGRVTPLTADGSYRTYLESHGFQGELFVPYRHARRARLSLSALSFSQRQRIRFLTFRQQLLQHIRTAGISASSYGIVAAMALGDRSAITPQQRESFSVAGTSHLLALSGLHLGILYMLLIHLLPRRRLPMASMGLTLLSIWAFVLLVGLPVSTVRAATMLTLYGLVSLLHRSRTPVATLSLTAFVILLARPYALFDVGFQLSFASVLAILVLQPMLDSLLPAHWQQRHRWVRTVWGVTTVSLAAQLGTAPLVACYFGRFSVYFLLANYVAIPLSACILYVTLLLVLTPWWPAVQSLLAVVLSWLVARLDAFTQWLASWPGASIDGLHLTSVQTAALYVLILSLAAALHLYLQRRPGRWC